MTTEPPGTPPRDRPDEGPRRDDTDASDAARAADDTDDEALVDPGGAALAAEAGQSPGGSTQSIGRAGAIMASGTLVSRMLGLVRAALLTGVIGTTGYAADAFTAANSLPNTFYLLIAGGAVNAIFVPQIVRAKLRPDGDDFVNRIITISLALLAGATVVMTLLAPLAVRLYYNVDNSQALGLATVFAVICLPQIFFYGLYTILGQVLNAHGRFAGYMWAPALANIVAIVGLVWFQRAGFPTAAAPADWTTEMIVVLAGSATLSIIVQAVSLIFPLRRIGFRYHPVWGIRGHGLGEVSTVAKWTFGSIVVSSLGFVVTSRVLTRATRSARRPGTRSPASPRSTPPCSSPCCCTASSRSRSSPRCTRGSPRRPAAATTARHALPPPGPADAVGHPRARSRVRRGARALRRLHALLQELPGGHPRDRRRARPASSGSSSRWRGPTSTTGCSTRTR